MNTKLLAASAVALIFILSSCKTNQSIGMNNAKKEILDAETRFAQMVKTDGVAKAFLAFADEQAVMNRNEKLVKGKTAMKLYFDKQTTKILSLTWKPDFVDAAASGDMGYTYGEYQIVYLNKEGKECTDSGIFHTVWKRQPDGSWKFVWD